MIPPSAGKSKTWRTLIMDDNKQTLTSLFHKLCELSFLHDAALREDAYTKIRYTSSRRRKLQTRLYEKLFEELRGPWVGSRTNKKPAKHDNKTGLGVYEKLAVAVFKLRLSRQFDKADLLEYHCLKWKRLPGSLKSAFDPSQPVNTITEPNAALRLIAALSGTAPQQASPLLGYQNECYATNLQPKDLKSLLPEGPLLVTDSYKLRSEALLADQYILYSSDLFESPPTLEDIPNACKEHLVFHDIMAPGQGRNRFFAIQEAGEFLHDKKTRLTVFGALSHGYTDDMQVKLGLPELPSSTEKTLGVSSLTSPESPDDEGFHELSGSSNGTSQSTSEYSTTTGPVAIDIWTEALKLSPQKFYTWEMEGRRDGVTDCPYITEAGPIVFDELYNLVSRNVSYLVKTPTHYKMVSLRTLVAHSLIVLIGVPNTTFLNDMESLDFHVNPDIRLSGCSTESLHSTLNKLAVIGTDYIHLVRFIYQKELCGGLILHAFIGGLQNYLQCYRATVLSIDESSVQSPFQLTFTFQSLGKQLRFLSDMCMCSSNSKSPPSDSKPTFPVGVKLLSYLYKLCLEHCSTDYYPVLLSLVKHSCAPYIMFIQQWVFQGTCCDVYEEFIIEVDDQFLAYRDKHFWSHGFVISEKDKLDCVPMFLSELANDIFVCGKSINLIKLCCPNHFLCDSGVPPPKMEVTYSMDKLKAIDRNCLEYVNAIEGIAKDIKDKREKERLAREEAKEKALMEERAQAEKALAEVTGLIQQVKEAIDTKKKADLNMLKEQMEEAIKNRQLEKERETEVDSKYMVDALNRAEAAQELREQTRQELIDYYQKLTEEMDRREERAQWKIKRHKLNKARIQFFAEEQAKFERLKTEASEVHNKAKEGSETVEKKAVSGNTASSAASQTSEHPSVSVLEHPGSVRVSDRQAPSVPSPSLVSLIASGVKTDAPFKFNTNKSMNSSNASDSGFIPGTATVAGFPGRNTKDGDGDLSEDHTLHSVVSLGDDEHDGDETDISVASNLSVPSGRKKWSRHETKPNDLKHEPSSTSSRRTWDTASGDVNLAESPFPHGHPSESSIQFSIYGDKKLNIPKTNEIGGASEHPSPLEQAVTPNPSDSSIQGLLYPLNKEGDATKDATKDEVSPEETTTSTQENQTLEGVTGDAKHPTEKTIESKGEVKSTTILHAIAEKSNESAEDMPSEEQPQEDPVIQDFLRSLSKGVGEIRTLSLGHPSDSNMRAYMSESHTTKGLKIANTKSSYGHPNESRAQSILYPPQDLSADLPPRPRSLFGHPNESSAQSTLYPSEDPSADLPPRPRSLFGHPNESSAQSTLYPSEDPSADLPPRPRSLFGHPNESRAQSILYPPQDSSVDLPPRPRSLFGHPNESSAQSTLYPPQDLSVDPPPRPRSLFGHPNESSAQSTLYPPQDLSVDLPPRPRSLFGHPNESSAQSTLYPSEDSSVDLPPRPRSLFGHPNESSGQSTLYPSQDSLADPPPRPRSLFGHPNESSAQSTLYPSQDSLADLPPRPRSLFGHPNESSAQSTLYPSEDSLADLPPRPRSLFGHTNESSAQSTLYPSEDSLADLPPRPRSLFGHPNESSAQSTLYPSEDSLADLPPRPRSLFGHPNESSAQSTLYPSEDSSVDLPPRPRSLFGHPNESSAQSTLYPSEDSSVDLPPRPRSLFGHPNESSAQSTLYPSEDSLADLPPRPRSLFGHPNESSAQSTLYPSEDSSVDLPPRPRSLFGHPNESSAQSTLYPSEDSSVDLPPRPRSLFGHPNESSAQSTLYPSEDSLADPPPRPRSTPVSLLQDRMLSENTRGTPPVDSAKDIIYPVGESVSRGGTKKSTRGHEPAVKITKLMYPAERKQELAPEPAKPLQFEDVWFASEVEPLQVNFNILDEQPTTDLLKSALSAVPIDRDDDDDIDAARLMTLPVLLRRSVTAPLTAQISLVNSAVVQYFMDDLNLLKHFEVFRKFLFMEDGEFALSLSDQVFHKLTAGVSPIELCSPIVMNGIITRALQLSVYADKTGFEQQLSFALKIIPDMFNLNDIGTLDFLELRYRVQWPLNIIITENSIIKYNKVFSFMLRLKRVAWVLREIWFHLKHIGFSRRAAGSPQLRQLQLFRHEMLHFLQNIDGYLSNQILNVTWAEFKQELTTNVRDLDDLHHRHTEYLNKAVFRSLLSKKAAPVMKIISDMFSLVLKFRTQLLSCPWQQDSGGGHVTHPRFDVMCSTHKAFKEYSGFLFTVLSKLVRRGYQSHLQDFLLRLNFNDYYKT